MSGIEMRRVWAMPNAETFSVDPIHNFVWKYLSQSKVSIDPFARNRDWATYTNDLDPATSAQVHVEDSQFLNELVVRGVMADLVIFDPPYSIEQCARSYKNVGIHVTDRDTQIFGRWTEHKAACDQLLGPGGIFLNFGWHTNGMGKKHGFEPIEVLLVAHGAGHNDTICMAERRIQPSLFRETL